MTSLKKEKEWLSMEALHQITETFPKDLHALSEVYRVVKDKEKVHSDVDSSLQTIHEKLKTFEEQAEHNKQNEIKKHKLVIEKR